MANQAIDRNSIDVAREIITRLTGRKSLIRPVLAQFLKSCAAANEVTSQILDAAMRQIGQGA